MRGSEPYAPGNLLDRLTSPARLARFDAWEKAREGSILRRRLGLAGGRVLSVGAGWYPGRHLFPAPQWRMTAIDADPATVEHVRGTGAAEEAEVGFAGHLRYADSTFDVVLYRLVLHHVVYRAPLEPVFAEAARLLRRGGAVVAVEPGLWHPIGLGLAAANRIGVGTAIHGTPDDIPISPRRLLSAARAAGLEAPELHAVAYGWRRLPVPLQAALRPLDALGSRPRAAPFGHSVLVIARAPVDLVGADAGSPGATDAPTSG